MSAPASGRTRAPFPRLWTVTLEVLVHADGRQTLKNWLLDNCEEASGSFADQLRWFIDCQLTGNADYHGVALSFELATCRPTGEDRA